MNNVVVTALRAGAVFAAVAAFVPGSAEAHCGAHAGSCNYTTISNQWCDLSANHWVTQQLYGGCCDQADGPDAPCNPGHCSAGGPLYDTWDENWGQDSFCGP